MSELMKILSVIVLVGINIPIVWFLISICKIYKLKKSILPDPFYAEILYKGEVIGYLTERERMDFGWEQYTVIPLMRDGLGWYPKLHSRVRNQEIIFRDPKTQRVCTDSYFTPDFENQVDTLLEGKIVLRELFFTKTMKRL